MNKQNLKQPKKAKNTNKVKVVNVPNKLKNKRMNRKGGAKVNNIGKQVAKVRPRALRRGKVRPITPFLRTLLYPEQQSGVPIPLQNGKQYYGKISFQNSIAVNTNGNAIVAGDFALLGAFASGSATSPILYWNGSAYDPTVKTNTATGPWNTTFLTTSQYSLSTTDFTSSKVYSAHVSFSLSGTSVLNKKGRIHLFEDDNPTALYGNSSDTTYGAQLINEYSINDLPLCTHYTMRDLANWDSNNHIHYNYIPQFLNSNQSLLTLGSSYTQGIVATSLGLKKWGLIAQGLSNDCTINMKYEIHYVADVTNDSVNKYNPVFTNSFEYIDPYLCFINRNTNLILTDSRDIHSNYYASVVNQMTSGNFRLNDLSGIHNSMAFDNSINEPTFLSNIRSFER